MNGDSDGALIAGPILGQTGAGALGLGALIIFAVGATTLALQELSGIMGVGLAILLIGIAGNPSDSAPAEGSLRRGGTGRT
ncbi:hypothetical protein [Streptomyces sp. NPDC004266]|uniref:hypothetical protein n=1 Tax=Streptomyces sp. NPDC004266 TaxID=3364693 RepID=UPI0036896F0C